MKQLFIAICLIFTGLKLQAQVVDPSEVQAARAALSERNVDEDEVKRRLKAKGIDLDNIQPDQLPGLEDEIKTVIAEIESEQAGGDQPADFSKESQGLGPVSETKVNDEVAAPDTTSMEGDSSRNAKNLTRESADDIRDRIKDGATLDEAIYDELTEDEQSGYSAQTRVYGMDIFFNNSLDFYIKASTSTTPNSYVLDVGDKIAINIFGASQADFVYEIEEDGFIRPSAGTRVAKIYLKGVSLGKAKNLLRGRFSQAYLFNADQFEVSLHTARTITVNIFGEVNSPGSYTISALNTGLNALIAAGGPNGDASLRNIRIMSSSGNKNLDVYEFMVDPNKRYDYYLRNNDLIYVPKFDKRISIGGAGVRRASVYELKNDEHYKEALKWAGGYSTNLHDQLIQHVYSDSGQLKIKDYTKEEIEASKLKLLDGDQLIFHSSLKDYENYVSISGSVRHPGKFELKPEMKLSDILAKAVVEKEAYSQVGYLRRRNYDGTYQLIRLYIEDVMSNPDSEHNLELKNEDNISLFFKSQYVDKYKFSISGAVRNPGTHFWDPSENITLFDAIMLAQGMEGFATDFGYIISSPPNRPLNREYTVIDLKTAFENPGSAANVRIRPNDKIVIPSVQQYSDELYVSISGAVRKPGSYIYDPTLSFKDVLVMAGGLRTEAASNKIDVFRLKIENNEPTLTYAQSIEIDHELNALSDNIPFELKPYDHIVVRKTPEFEPIQYIRIEGEVKYPGLYALTEPNERISSVINRSGGFTQEAFPAAGSIFRSEDDLGMIITRMDLIQNRKYRSRYNLVLKDGDVITIPKMKEIVTIDIVGTNADEVYSEDNLKGETIKIAVAHYNRSAKWYINHFAGGFDKDAKRKKTFVKNANGQIKKTRSFWVFRVYPKVKLGSEIHLGLKDKVLKEADEVPPPPAPKEEKSFLERMTELQTVVALTTSIMTTTLTTITILNGTK